MNLLEALAYRILGVKAAQMPYTSTTGSRLQAPDRRSFEQQVKEGYYKNQVVLACVSTRAQTLNEPPLVAVDANGAIQPQHPLSRLFKRPNKNMSQSMFWQYVSTYTDIGGNCYVHKVRNVYGQVIELHPYHSGHMVPVSTSGEWVDYYQYDFDGVRKEIPARDIIHFRSYYIDPLNPVLGYSPIRAAGIDVDTYNELMTTLYSYLKNNGVPSGVLQVAGQIGNEQVNSLRSQFEEQVGGSKRGKPLILQNGMTYQQTGLNVKDMDAGGQFAQYEVAICGIFRVHPAVAMTMAGLQSSTYSNMAAAFTEYTNLTRIPTWNMWEEQVQNSFAQEFPGVDLEFDTSRVAALQPTPEQKSTALRGDYAANLITLNEARTALGYAEDPVDGDKYAYQRTAPQPTGFLTLPQPEQVTPLLAEKSYRSEPLPERGRIDQSKDVKAEEYWRSFDSAVKDLSASLNDDVVVVIEGLRDIAIDTTVKGLKRDPNSEIAKLVAKYMKATGPWREQLLQQIMALAVQSVGADMAQVTSYVDRIEKQVAADMAEKITQSIGTIREEVQDVVRSTAGQSADEIRKALNDKFDTLADSRANAIAQTTAKANATKTAQSTWNGLNEDESDPDEEIVKVWTTRRDGKVREQHRKRDGEWVVLGGTFEGGAEGPGLAETPGDAVNCRCTIRPTRRKNLSR